MHGRDDDSNGQWTMPKEVDLCEAAAALREDLRAFPPASTSEVETARELETLDYWASYKADESTSPWKLYDALSHLILNPVFTERVATHFSTLLVYFFDRAIQRLEVSDASDRDSRFREVLHALARLLRPFPALFPITRYFLSLPAVPTRPHADDPELESHLLSTYRLASAASSLFASDRNPGVAKAYLQIAKCRTGPSEASKLVALRIFTILNASTDATLQRLQAKYVGSPADNPERQPTITIQRGSTVVEEVNAWIVPIEEKRRAQALQIAIQSHMCEHAQVPVYDQSIRSRVECIGSTLFFRETWTSPPEPTHFQLTDTFQPAFHQLGHHLSRGHPVLLSGPEACGKTAIIRHLCRRIYPGRHKTHIVTLHLGDQSGVDSKSLIGTFVSSVKKPGTFEWVEGALTRAVRIGKWVVLEDVDKANGEVLAVIKALVEDMGGDRPIGSRPFLDLGSRGRVQAGESFSLFATRTASGGRRGIRLPKATFYGHEHWSEVQMQPLNEEDILSIISHRNRHLSSSVDQTLEVLVSTWKKLSEAAVSRTFSSTSRDKQLESSGSSRVPSLHDLLKWSQRLEHTIAKTHSAGTNLASSPLSNQALQEEMLMDASDIFLGSIPSTISAFELARQSAPTNRFSFMLRALAESLGVDATGAWHTIVDRKPECRLDSGEGGGARVVRIGRTTIQRSHSPPSLVQPPSRTFALTGPAARLMERIAVCISSSEPALIVGETGTGKTTVVQYLAALARKPLTALNLSQQTETSDLLGGFKPLDAKVPAMELHNDWMDIFQATFSSRRNARFMQAERKALEGQRLHRLCEIWKESIALALDKLNKSEVDEGGSPAKARKIGKDGARQSSPTSQMPQDALRRRWEAFRERMEIFAVQFTSNKRSMVFTFVEGPLVKAIRSGTWVLLDEINLATPETLDCLTGLLQSPESSIVLTERGDLEPVERHPEFRLFACMNPATDVGKRDLPSTLRARFTELYAPSPDSDQEALVSIVDKYIGEEAVGDRGIVMDVAQCYTQIRRLSQMHQLADGANQRPHYSIRTLSRALTFAKDTCAVYGLRRAVWEGFVMTFTMLLDQKSVEVVREILQREVLAKAKNANSAASFVPPRPSSKSGEASSYVQLGPFWLETGSQPVDAAPDYILTPSVQDKLVGLARAALTRRSPVLIQGPTSAGKTSAIEYLARRTGHKFVRINNHEHTDIQEYIGSYSSDADSGQLVFQEGLLVTALRQGHWIVLDELNLAPSDVLEALNRLLDDNRELFIPETGQTVTPHPHFMLFATQNPPGLYAGRKVLSRAFRNRFLEMHFSDVPQAELQTILTNRCQIPPSYAEKVVKVFRELQRRRQTGRVFDTKQAFVTLRDLFRWGRREAQDYQELAENGYILIAERARRPEDALVVQQVIEEVINVKIDPSRLYNIFDSILLQRRVGSEVASSLLSAVQGTIVVWTTSMQRLACLIAISLRYSEPVLLVGETGSGKTSVCEILANAFGQKLVTVNCHQSTDAADLLGGQRPLRNRSTLQESARVNAIQVMHAFGMEVDEKMEMQEVVFSLASVRATDAQQRDAIKAAMSQINHSLALFEWSDGPLVEAMKQGQHMLLDEISLADDSVLERLNSVLEPGRTLVLAEKSSRAGREYEAEIMGHEAFQIVATMNPGGDYGKKELSPALRNRFTEIWVPPVQERDDLMMIVNSQWVSKDREMTHWAGKMVDFLASYTSAVGGRDLNAVGLRDLIAWARFINEVTSTSAMPVAEAFIHGAFMTLIDGAALQPAVVAKERSQIDTLIAELSSQVFAAAGMSEKCRAELMSARLTSSETHFALGKFSQTKGPYLEDRRSSPAHFSLQAPTPAMNALRVLRAMLIKDRAIMLEGSPGAGKTSLIVALAGQCNYKLTRINLSDQTELSDLFGADLPVEGGKAGEFDWKDAAFLSAMQEGSWVLLDEMNLASQSVLEGLNSCLDHRGAVFIPELGRTFVKHANFRIFAAQNPQHQGGGRKGLPKSFLNRFTKVHVEELRNDDFSEITSSIYPHLDVDLISKMVKFNTHLQSLLSNSALFSKAGQPWEFNLRDMLRWLDMMHAHLGLNRKVKEPLDYLASLYLLRFRTRSDRVKVGHLYASIFGIQPDIERQPWMQVTPRLVQVGHVVLSRKDIKPANQRKVTHYPSMEHLGVLQALGEAVRLSLPAILVGESRAGKTTLIRQLAQIADCQLEEVRLNSGTDAIDVIGGFQQDDMRTQLVDHIWSLLESLRTIDTSLLLDDEADADHLGRLQDAETFLHCQLDQLDGVEEEASLPDWERLITVAAGLCDSLSLLSHRHSSACGASLTALTSLRDQHSTKSGGKFAWVDGPVLRAMRKGAWLLLDEANLCSSSVLDRLNSLLEPGGRLVLSERGVMNDGEVEVVVPHPDFRIFFAINPRYGELSRAMRNRGLEVFVEPFKSRGSCVEDAGLWNLERWTAGICPSVAKELSHKASMQLALLGQSLPASSREVLPQLLRAEHSQLVRWLLTEEASSLSNQLKRHLEEFVNAEARFSDEGGLDLQVNPNTHRDDPEQQSFYHRLQLIVKSGAMRAYLQQLVDSPPSNEELSILQRSALFGRGIDAESLSRRDRHLYPLLESMATVTQDVVCSKVTAVSEDASRALYTLLDCCGYLASKWSQVVLNDYSVGRIVLKKALVALANSSLDGTSLQLENIRKQIEAASDQVQLTSGLAMHQIWRAFLPPTLDAAAANQAVSIRLQLDQMRRKGDMQDLTASAIDVAAALWSVGTQEADDQQRSELLTIGQRVLAALEAQCKSEFETAGVREREDDDDVLLLAVMCLTTRREQRSSSKFHQLDRLVDLIKTSRSFPASTAISSLAKEVHGESSSALCFDSDFTWVHHLFRTTLASHHPAQRGNTEDLMRPVLLQTVLARCSSSSDLQLAQLNDVSRADARLAQVISSISPAEISSRSQSIADILSRELLTLSTVLLKTIAEQTELTAPVFLARLGPLQTLDDVQKVVQELREGDWEFPSETETVLLHLEKYANLASSLHGEAEQELSCQEVGTAAVQSALGFIDDFLPNIAIDPLASLSAEMEYRAYQTDRLEQEKEALTQMEGAITGNSRNRFTDEIDGDLTALKTAHVTSEESLLRQSNTKLLHKFVAEMRSFVQQAINLDKIDELMQHTSHEKLRGRLLNAQVTICAQLERLPQIYSPLWDLTRPVHHALSILLLGTGLLLHSSSTASRSRIAARSANVLLNIVAFPTSVSTSRYLSQELPIGLKADSTPGSLAVPLLLLKVRAVLADVITSGHTSSSVRLLPGIYDQLWHLWTLDEEHQRQKREEEQSLYKVQKLDMSVEEEERRENEEFLSLFPEYIDVMDDDSEMQRNSDPSRAASKTKRSYASFFAGDDVLQLFNLHLAIFKDEALKRAETFEIARVDVSESLVEANYSHLSEVLDRESASLQMTVLSDRLRGDDGEDSDFYVGANMREAAKLVSLLDGVVAKLDLLIKDWPDQEVLQHIKQRCQRILQLGAKTSVHQMLASLEGLLQHTEDWQIFASSKNSLKTQREEIIAVIVEWRRLELHGWKGLLSKETVQSRNSVHDMWFTLFQVVAKTEYSEEDRLVELISLLDQYMRGSTIGQYSTRLNLIESFALYLRSLRVVTKGSEPSRIESVLLNVHHFFDQSREAIQSRQDSRRNAIEKEISDFVKLASWKDTNIHALKVSAAKTHRKLHRCLRKYRDALNEAVDPILASSYNAKAEMKAGQANGQSDSSTILTARPLLAHGLGVEGLQEWHADDSTPLHLVRLPTTLSTLHGFYEKEIGPYLWDDAASFCLLDLQETVVARSDAFARQTPTFWKEENDKLIKHLETRKRKAWSDLLRELQRIGLGISSIDGVAASSLAKGTQVYTVAELANTTGIALPHLDASNRLHFRLLALLPVVRATISSTSRNLDVPVNQLQKCLSFVENCFLASIVERKKLSASVWSLQSIRGAHDRVAVLLQDAPPVMVTTAMHRSLPSCLDLWTRLGAALEEIQRTATEHARISSSNNERLKSSLDLLDTCRTEVTGYSMTLRVIVESVSQLSPLSTLEAARLSEGSILFNKVLQSLQNAQKETPVLRSMCIPTLTWLRQTSQDFLFANGSGLITQQEAAMNETSAGSQSDRIISSIVLIAQELRQIMSSAVSEQSTDELADRGIAVERQRLAKIEGCLRHNQVKDELDLFFGTLSSSANRDESRAALARVSPFLELYVALSQNFVHSRSRWYHSLVKLNLTLCNLLTSLASSGFCKPKQEEEQSGEAGNGADEQLEGGMGLGDGEGAQDVTDTLQDDDAMEELEKDEAKKDKDDEKNETTGEKNAREMQDDFEGDLEDVEKEEETEKDPDDGEGEEEKEMDEGVGEVDPLDLDAVDEKTWAGEQEDDQKGGKDKGEKEEQGTENDGEAGQEGKEAPKASKEDDKGAEGAGQRAQEGDERKERKDPDNADEEKAEEKDKDGVEEGEGEAKSDGEEDEEPDQGEGEAKEEDEQRDQDNGLGRAIDAEARQAENLDLDEDLQMDDASDKGDSDGDMDALSDVAPDGSAEKEDDTALSVDEEQDDDRESDLKEAQEEKSAADDDPDEAEEDVDGDDQVPHAAGEEPIEDEDEVAMNEAEGRLASDEETKMDSNGQMGETQFDEAAMGGDANQDAPANQNQSVQSSSTGRQANATTQSDAVTSHGAKKERADDVERERETQDKAKAGGGGEEKQDSGKEGQGSEEDEQADHEPARSLGDALREFRRNMDSIEERLGRDANEEGRGMPEEDDSSAVEHIRNDEDAEMQALGAAREEEALQALQDVAIEGDEAEDESKMRLDEEVEQLEAQEKVAPARAPQDEGKEERDAGDGQGGLMTGDLRPEGAEDGRDFNASDDSEHPDSPQESLDEEDCESAIDETIKGQMDALFSTVDLMERQALAQELWKSYVDVTSDYAFTLSEQLRLILAPTKATKLTGDFRTGKRLNMRKIIPFIASDYLKDKIWLRRNLPQKREYQVLLCIDDSKSMLESKNMLLAFKSLALVCSALDKLEVGQVGVIKFGKQGEVLKPMDGDMIQEDQGGKILEQLKFQQRGTDVSAMLQTSHQVLMEAREKQSTSANHQLWQLQIIISDGVCQDHTKLQALLRRAAEERILVVFVILDSLQQNSSILTMNSVQYKAGANGRPQIEMTRYLDTFPFEYFVVVRDVSDLPDVLSSTLRQWAQKIADL